MKTLLRNNLFRTSVLEGSQKASWKNQYKLKNEEVLYEEIVSLNGGIK